MSQVDRTVPNWGQANPLPELEGVINLLNGLRAEPQFGDRQWEQSRTAAYTKAARLLGVTHRRRGTGPSSKQWNETIDALDRYRADWRGEVVPVRRVEVA